VPIGSRGFSVGGTGRLKSSGRSNALKIKISRVRWDNRRLAPISNSSSVRSEAGFESKGRVCLQFSMRVRRGWARVKSAVRDGDSRIALSVLQKERFSGWCEKAKEQVY
jgi:hypothetical protein